MANYTNSSHGVLCLLKPPGMTSHDAVAHVRRVLKTKRVGHTGTLDPAATGVLVICVGQATRLVEALQADTKEYLAEATFGYETDTLDAVGKTVQEQEATSITRSDVERVCRAFRGEIQQRPPLYSAIKIGGQKLYDVARAGGEVKIPTRTITLFALEVTHFYPGQEGRPPRAFLRIECSSGTYIRSLVRDIGYALNNIATMTFLNRVRNGRFSLTRSITPQELEQSSQLTPLPKVLAGIYGPIRTDESVTNALWQGRQVPLVGSEVTKWVVWSNDDQTLLALARSEWKKVGGKDEGQWKPEKVFDLRAGTPLD